MSGIDISVQNIYIDESGSPPKDKHFIIAVLLIKDIHSLKTIKNAIEDLQQTTKTQDIKGSQLSIEQKKHFIKKIHKASYEVWVPFDERIKIDFANNIDKNSLVRLSLHYIKALLDNVIVSHHGLTNVIFDEHTLFYKSMTQPTDKNLADMSEQNKDRHEYIKMRRWYILTKCLPQNVPAPRMVEGKSLYVKGLMAADIFANGVYRKRQKNDEEFYNLFKERVRIIIERLRV